MRETSNTPKRRLTPKQAEALSLIARHGIRYVNDPSVYAPVTTVATAVFDGMVYLNWRTAHALERKGFGRVTGWGEETEFVLKGSAA